MSRCPSPRKRSLKSDLEIRRLPDATVPPLDWRPRGAVPGRATWVMHEGPAGRRRRLDAPRAGTRRDDRRRRWPDAEPSGEIRPHPRTCLRFSSLAWASRSCSRRAASSACTRAPSKREAAALRSRLRAVAARARSRRWHARAARRSSRMTCSGSISLRQVPARTAVRVKRDSERSLRSDRADLARPEPDQRRRAHRGCAATFRSRRAADSPRSSCPSSRRRSPMRTTSSIVRLRGDQAFVPLLVCLRILGWQDPTIVARQFDQLVELAASVPIYGATIPWQSRPSRTAGGRDDSPGTRSVEDHRERVGLASDSGGLE